MKVGKYVVIEGHDGTGKSTQVGILRERLKEQGVDSVEFHEPDGTPIADAIRTLIKNGDLERDGMTNLLLFSAARHDIWTKKALTALRDGKWVIASRNYYSTLAYQGYGEGIAIDVIKLITRTVTDDKYMQPDLSVILSLDDESERVKRIAARGELKNPDTFESKAEDFQKRVKQGYIQIARDSHVPIISAQGTVDEVTDRIWRVIEPLF